MNVHKISSKLIKPHTPTPQNLKNYTISFADKVQRPINLAVVLFYQSKPEHDSQLEESLAKTLVQFYLLAGRYIKNDHMVDCSDEGAEFVKAEALDLELMDLVAAKNIETEQLNALLPDQYFRVDEAATDPLLSIQATHFPCGGVAIAISVTHRVFDISSLGTFIAAWSNASNPDNKMDGFEFELKFDLPSLLPYKEHDFVVDPKKYSKKKGNDDKIVIKRLLFDKAALASLRLKIRPNNNGKPISRVRAVCAIIAKALIGLDRVKHGKYRDFLIFQPVNMRERTITPMPKHTCGNFSFNSLTRRVAASEAEGIGMEELLDVIGDGVRKCIADRAETVSPNRDGRDIIINMSEKVIKAFLDPEMNVIVFSDWSKFDFYEADFGSGKPIWTSIGPQSNSNMTKLMSNKEGDGIEAWVHLTQNDMRYFEQDEEIKLFTA